MILIGLLAAGFAAGTVRGETLFRDKFGRDLESQGISLVDWEGYMANPAIEFFIVPPAEASLPVDVRVTASEPRLYFDLPSQAGAAGPEKRLQISTSTPVAMAVAIFPARTKKRMETMLHVQLTDAQGRRSQRNLPVHVTFNPGAPSPDSYPITVDFSQDKTGFFSDSAHRAALQQAAKDWAFYFAAIPLEKVAAHAEKTFIFQPSGFAKGEVITNAQPYMGNRLYAYGISSAEHRSGGEPSREGGWQMSDGRALPIRRSGGVEVEIKGNYNLLGWLPPLRDDEWWRATNLGEVPNDLYSSVHHEMGHALVFNPNNQRFKREGPLPDAAVEAYLGRGVQTDKSDHLDGFVDPASLRGAFGNEYHGKVPYGRWLITKLDLLCAQAMGYKLRKVDALTALAILPEPLPGAVPDQSYRTVLHAEGGIPFYDWTVKSGKLPAGLGLNRFTGEISGIPGHSGTFPLVVQLRDYSANGPAVTRDLVISVQAP